MLDTIGVDDLWYYGWLEAEGTRYHTAPAVDCSPGAAFPSGRVIYSVRGEEIDDGETLLLGND